MLRRMGHWLAEATRRYFVAGILFFAPIGITLWAIASIVLWLDNLILPRVLRLLLPGVEDLPRLPLVGMLFTFFVIILLGVIARHLFGHELVRIWEQLLARVPIARSIYSGVKQLFEAVFSDHPHAQFRRVVLIEFPRKGVYALAFVTGAAQGVVQDATEEFMINCFMPTTPNPTSGFYLLVPEKELIETTLTVEDAFKLVMSAGLVTPGQRATRPVPIPAPSAAPAVARAGGERSQA